MRHLLITLSAILIVSGSASVTWAGTVKLHATNGQIQYACAMAIGQPTDGIGKGGIGCKTSKGEIECDSKGNCTGTCGNCGSRTTTLAQIVGSRPTAPAARGY